MQHLQGADLESYLEITWKQFRVWVSSVGRADRKRNNHCAERIIEEGIQKERGQDRTVAS